ncbi:maleylpyruvate isomerase family mycothiol-dependent enzyme [Nocardioides mangrovicus]|nr:maleylpyruvate isomerase family mycothiol-dependent enzyme [Nocardioides mangrovicus]
MDPATHVDHLEAEGARVVAAASRCTGQEAVAACPGWDVDQLLRHLATVHEWSRRAVVGGGAKPPPRRPLEADAPADHTSLVAWYAELHRRLVDELRDADPDAACWQMWSGPDGPAYWARRQAHETAVHRIDVEIAADRPTPLDAGLAVDGIDELMMLVPRLLPVTEPHTVYHLLATDTGDSWRVVAGPELTTVERGHSAEGVQVSGSAADLYAFCWNRRPGTTPVVSDPSQWEVWRGSVQV